MAEVGTVFDGGDAIGMADIQEFVTTIQQAFAVHVDRERIRHGLWKEYPAEDQCNQIKVKIDRVKRSLERMSVHSMGDNQDLADNILEELYDIINYSVFAARLLEGRV